MDSATRYRYYTYVYTVCQEGSSTPNNFISYFISYFIKKTYD